MKEITLRLIFNDGTERMHIFKHEQFPEIRYPDSFKEAMDMIIDAISIHNTETNTDKTFEDLVRLGDKHIIHELTFKNQTINMSEGEMQRPIMNELAEIWLMEHFDKDTEIQAVYEDITPVLGESNDFTADFTA